jgi:3D (Asp-Asp-Asp) domain-containing protein
MKKEDLIGFMFFVAGMLIVGSVMLLLIVPAPEEEIIILEEEKEEIIIPATEMPDPCELDTVVCSNEKLYTVTAYTSYAAQTDSSPCISADGSNICHLYSEGTLICASNDYPLGTALHVDGYGDCIVADRMNSRYTDTGRVDIYMGYDTPAALQWGIRQVKVTEL